MGVKFIGLEPSDNFSGNIPCCPHGPMLLFEHVTSRNAGRRFYACAGCRDRKSCSYHLWADETLSGDKAERWKLRVQLDTAETIPHQTKFDRAQKVLALPGVQYCSDCSVLLDGNSLVQHRKHKLRAVTSNTVIPPKLLCPLSDNKKEAQYMFSDATTALLSALLPRAVLSMAAPSVHAHLLAAGRHSFMLDCDVRYEEFYPPEKMAAYNMFNHHFFTVEGRRMYTEFLQSHSDDVAVVVDPPFGGRLEALALTLTSVTADRRRVMPSDADSLLPVLLVLPYFMEPDVLHCLPGFHMTDLRIDYSNHHKFTAEERGGRRFGSPVRLFTNLPPSSIHLPAPDYRLCADCQRYVHSDNVHCPQCKQCTSKDGRPYRHCDRCARCVKDTWSHCDLCGRCALPSHPCVHPDDLLMTVAVKRGQTGSDTSHRPKRRVRGGD